MSCPGCWEALEAERAKVAYLTAEVIRENRRLLELCRTLPVEVSQRFRCLDIVGRLSDAVEEVRE